jgi:hypothetical protein
VGRSFGTSPPSLRPRLVVGKPAVVKLQRDVFEERSYRLKVVVPQGDVETTVEADSSNQTPRKAL